MGAERRPNRLCSFLLAIAMAAAAAPPATAAALLRTIETSDLRLVYPGTTLEFMAPYTARCFENSMRFHRALFGYTPSEKVTVVLVDNSDYGNAAVIGSPRNTMIVQIAPNNFVYETGPSNERINFVMNHELAHVVTLDQAAGSDRLFRALFRGKVRETSEHPETILYGFLTLPRRAAPRWHREGTAVFLETWMAGGLGRAQGPYDEMVFRAMVRDGSHFYDPLGLESEGTRVDFQVGVNAYLYGTRFTSWVADRWGPDRFVEWVARHPGSRPYFASQFHQVFGLSITDAWRQWVASEKVFQQANLDSVRRHPTTRSRDLSTRALGSVSRAVLDSATGTVYAGVYYPGAVSHIAAIPLDGGATRVLHEVKGPALYFVSSLAWDPGARRLFYTADNNEWRDLCELDPATGTSRTLIRDARIGDLAFDRRDRSLWGVRHFNGISTIVRLPPPYTDWSQVFSFPYGRDVYDLDISPDGSRMALSMAEISGRQSLRLLPLDALAVGDTASRTLFDFGSSIPTSFVFSDDGRYLYGSSYYTGVSNIFRYDLAADSMDIVTNAETGFFRPLPLGGDSLIAFRFTGAGFVPAVLEARPLAEVSTITFYGQQVVERHPVLKSWKVPPPSTVPIDSLILYRGPYRALRSVRLVSLYPIVESYKDDAAVGLAARLTDPVSLHDFTLSASYSPQQRVPGAERWHGSASYRHSGINLVLRHNPASFYDLVGPTKVSRKGDGFHFDWKRSLVRDTPRLMDLTLALNGWTGLERLPDAQNVSIRPGFEKLVNGGVELHHQNMRSSIGAVDREKGWQWRLGTATNAIRFERAGTSTWRAFPSYEGGADAGTPLLLRNSSLWLRTAAGFSPGDRDEPFANFFFGGFGNNRLDHQEVQRYREGQSFPGKQIDAVAGTTYGKAMLDWNLPPLRFDRFGTPALYASWLRTSVFTSVLSTNVNSRSDRRTLANAGVQCDLRVSLLTQQPLTLSIGYARAFERREKTEDELMVSLKIL